MCAANSSPSNLIKALTSHLPEEPKGDYEKAWQEFCNTFASDLASNPDKTLEQLLQSQIMVTAQMYFRTLFEIHRLTNDSTERSNYEEASTTCELPQQVVDDWIPRMNRQQKSLIELIDSYGRFKDRINRLESQDD